MDEDLRKEMERAAAQLGKLVNARVPRGCFFALLIFGDDWCQYVSSAQRLEMAAKLREQAEQLEAQA